jgi:hypothetical protein
MCGENKLVINWPNLYLSPAGLSWPLYIGGQVSRIRSGSIQIIVSVYHIISYFDYIYAWPKLLGPRGTKITGLNSYTLVSTYWCRRLCQRRHSLSISCIGLLSLHQPKRAQQPHYHWLFSIEKMWVLRLPFLEILNSQAQNFKCDFLS